MLSHTRRCESHRVTAVWPRPVCTWLARLPGGCDLTVPARGYASPSTEVSPQLCLNSMGPRILWGNDGPGWNKPAPIDPGPDPKAVLGTTAGSTLSSGSVISISSASSSRSQRDRSNTVTIKAGCRVSDHTAEGTRPLLSSKSTTGLLSGAEGDMRSIGAVLLHALVWWSHSVLRLLKPGHSSGPANS